MEKLNKPLEALIGAAVDRFDVAQNMLKLPNSAFAGLEAYQQLKDAIAYQVQHLSPSDYQLTKDALHRLVLDKKLTPYQRGGIESTFTRCRMNAAKPADIPTLLDRIKHDATRAEATAALNTKDYATAVDKLKDAGVDGRKIESLEAALSKANPRPTLGLVRLSDVQRTKTEWLWAGRLPKGKMTIIGGDPSVGKSFLTCDIVARLTTGQPFPFDDRPRQPVSVLMANVEDGISDTIVARLEDAGADLSRVQVIDSVKEKGKDRTFSLKDISALEDAIKANPEIKCIVIDPIGAYMGKTNTHQDSETKDILTPLNKFADRYGISLICVMHLRKSSVSDSTKAMYRLIGSIAFVGSARTAYLVTPDKDDADRRIVTCVKSNGAKLPRSIAYRIVDPNCDDSARVEWDSQEFDLSSDEALNGKDSTPKLNGAKEWLAEQLEDGERLATDIYDAARDAGVSSATLRRAKDDLRIETRRVGYNGPWHWSLPLPADRIADDDDSCPF